MVTSIKKIAKIIIISSLLMTVFINYGCSPAGVLATGGGSAMVVAEGERSLGTVIDDATIKVNVATKFLSSPDNLFIDIDTSVIQGRVLLTGLVDNQEIRIDAVRRVWEVEGVKEVVNEIDVGNRENLKEYANDLWITTQSKALAIKTIGLRGLSYNFETIKGRVYVIGITSKQDQLDSVIKVVRTIKGVKEIVNYVIINEG